MCAPAVLAGVSMMSQYVQGQAMNSAAASQANQLVASANRNAVFNYSQMNERERQEQLQATQQEVLRMRQGLRERATLASRTASAGIAGQSPSRDVIASAIWQAEDIGATRTALENSMGQAEAQKRGIQANTESTLNQAKSVRSQITSPWMQGLNIGLAGIGGWSQGQNFQNAHRLSKQIGG